MKLAIFGGTGLVGSALVDLAVRQSHEVTILARKSHKTRALPPGVRVVTGDALDPAAVMQTLDDGCDAVMSALGGFNGPESLSRGTALVLDGMRTVGLRRLVVLQGMHLTVPGDAPNPGRWLVQAFMHLRAKEITRHAELMWHQLQAASDIDWTLVRIPRVGKDGAIGHLDIGNQRLGPWSSITRHDAARAMMLMLLQPGSTRTAPLAALRGRKRPVASPRWWDASGGEAAAFVDLATGAEIPQPKMLNSTAVTSSADPLPVRRRRGQHPRGC